jgi:hypothetical protein
MSSVCFLTDVSGLDLDLSLTSFAAPSPALCRLIVVLVD